MKSSSENHIYIKYILIGIWACNCILGGALAIKEAWLPNINAGNETYTSIKSDPFDGTTKPILYIPDWSKTQYQNKAMQFSEIPISDYIPLPDYNNYELLDTNNTSKSSLISHYTYITPYMGSYRLNYKENDGSHNAVDIRAPIGTPVLAIANGVIVKTVEADPTGNKYIVIRHDNINIQGKIQNLYSGYLHLSQISVKEGTKIKKGEMIGRVGITGITTTPHLHIQIDTEDAPFHPYWPFTSAESRSAGLSFFDSVNAGLGKESAKKYSIHPMEFISQFITGVTPIKIEESGGEVNNISNLSSAPQVLKSEEIIPVNASVESIVASMVTTATPSNQKSATVIKNTTGGTSTSVSSCVKKRFSDISSSTKVGKTLYQLVDTKCMFQDIGTSFDSMKTMNQKEAIMLLMKYYSISPSNGTSHFLDIAIGDPFQGYAISAYRKGILEGNYAFPEKILTRADFIELIVKIGKVERNPSQLKIYNDANAMNLKFKYIQDYGFKVKARGGKISPDGLLTRQGAIELLGNILIQDGGKK